MSDADTTKQLQEGDVFRWSYREPGDDRSYGRYHCCSRVGIVRNGLLRDTYWMIGNNFPSSDGRFFSETDLSKLNLERLGNLAELEKVADYNEDYYDDADIVDLNHANSSRGNFYIRKGAKRSAAKMLQSARRNLFKAESDQRSAAQRAEHIRKQIAAIEAGDTSTML